MTWDFRVFEWFSNVMLLIEPIVWLIISVPLGQLCDPVLKYDQKHAHVAYGGYQKKRMIKYVVANNTGLTGAVQIALDCVLKPCFHIQNPLTSKV